MPKNPEEIIKEWKRALKNNDDYIDVYNNVKNIAGSKPDIGKKFYAEKKYNELEIPVNEEKGISEDIIQLVTLGAMMDSELLENAKSIEIEAKEVLCMNVLNQMAPRERYLQPILYDGRKMAKAAIESYLAGDHAPLEKCVKNIIDYASGPGNGHNVSITAGEGQIFNAIFDLLSRTSNSEIIKNVHIDDSARKKWIENVEIGKAIKASNSAEHTLADKLPSLGAEEKRGLIKTVMRGYMMQNLKEGLLVDAKQELTEFPMIKEMKTDIYFNQNVLPELVEKGLTSEADQKKLRASWKTLNVDMGTDDEMYNVIRGLNSYQTDELSNENTRNNYLEKLDSLIEHSDIYTMLSAETEVGEFVRKLNLAKSGKFSVYITDENNKSSAVPFSASLVSNKNNTLSKDVKDRFSKAILDGSRKQLDKSINQLVEDKLGRKAKEDKKYIYQKIEEYARANNIQLDFDKSFADKNAGLSNFDESLGNAYKTDGILYIKNRKGGFCKVEIDRDNKDIDISQAFSIPYSKANIKDVDSVNNANAEAVELDKRSFNGIIRTQNSLRALSVVMEEYVEEKGRENVSPEYLKLLDEMDKLHQQYSDIYGPSMDERVENPSVNAEQFEKLMDCYGSTLKCANDYITINPFDRGVVNFKESLESDLEILNNVDNLDDIEKQLSITATILENQRTENEKATVAGGDDQWTKECEKNVVEKFDVVRDFTGSVLKPRNGVLGKEMLETMVIHPDEGKGITEEVIQAVTFGAYLEEVKQGKWNPNGESTRGIMDPRRYFFDTVYTGHSGRDTYYNMLLTDGRKKAMDAIEAYKRGDTTLVDQYSKNLNDFVVDVGLINSVNWHEQNQAYAGLLDMVVKVADKDAFKNSQMTEETLNKCKEKVELFNLMRSANDAEKELSMDIQDGNSAERRDMLLDILTASVVNQISGAYNEEFADTIQKSHLFDLEHGMGSDAYFNSEAKPIVDGLLDGYDKESLLDIIREDWNGQVIQESVILSDNIKNSANTYQTDMLSDKDRKERYFRKIKDMIGSSKIFEDMMNEENPKNLKKLLDQAKADYKKIKPRSYSLADGKIVETEKVFDIADIPEKAHEKELFAERAKGISIDFDKVENQITDCFYNMVNEKKNTLQEKEANEKAVEIEKLIEHEIKEKKYSVDKNMIFAIEKRQKLNSAITDAILRNTPVYMKNKDGGVIEFKLSAGLDGKFDVSSTKMKSVPYSDSDVYKNQFKSAFNEEIMKQDAKEEDRPTYSECYKGLEAGIDVLKGMTENMADKPAELDELIGSLERLNTKICDVYEKHDKGVNTISAEEYKSFREAYGDSRNKLDQYFKINPFDKSTEALSKMINADIAVYDSKQKNPQDMVNVIGMTLENRNAEYVNKEEELEKGPDYFDKKIMELQAYRNPVKLQESMPSAIMYGYMFKTIGNELLHNPDGSIYSENGSFIKLNGEIFTPKKQAEFFEKNYEGVMNFDNDKAISVRDIHKNSAIDKDAIRDFVRKNELPAEAIIPDDMIAERITHSKTLETAFRKHIMKLEIEAKIACGGNTGKFARENFTFLDTSGTAEGRKANRELAEKLQSEKISDRKEAYETILDKLTKLNPAEYDLTKDLPLDDPEKMFTYRGQMAEVQNVLEQAKNAGVNLNSPKYEKVLNMSGISEGIGFNMGSKIEMEMMPTYDYIDYKAMKNVPQEKLKKAEENAAEKADLDDDLEIGADGKEPPRYRMVDTGMTAISAHFDTVRKTGKNWLYKGNADAPYENRLKYAEKNIYKMNNVVPEDKELVRLRDKLVNTKVFSLIGKHTNSEEFKKVIRSIDAYRAAPSFRKEEMRKKLVDACGDYVTKRKAGRERTKLIYELGKFATGPMAEHSAKHTENGLKYFGEELFNGYISKLRKNGSEPAKNLVDLLESDVAKRLIVDKLIKTDKCLEYVGMSEQKKKECCEEISEEAMKAVARQDNGYDVYLIPSEVKKNSEPEKKKEENEVIEDMVISALE